MVQWGRGQTGRRWKILVKALDARGSTLTEAQRADIQSVIDQIDIALNNSKGPISK